MPLEFFLKSETDRQQLISFLNIYHAQCEVVCPEQRPKRSPIKGAQTCRYCGATSLKRWKEAHTFSHALGNNTLFSYDECDVCNERFSTWETDLAAFLGPSRTLNQVRGKKGIPKSKSADRQVEIVGDDTWEGQTEHIKIERTALEKDAIRIDVEKGETAVTFVKETYRPLHVFKALIKMAYAILPQDDLPFYEVTKQFLNSSSLDNELAHTATINKITFTFGVGTSSPFLLLYKKKDLSLPHPTHVALLFWQNYVFQYGIPYHSADIERFGKKPMSQPQLPPFLFFEGKNVKSFARIVSLSSREPLKGEKETIEFFHGAGIPSTVYDTDTGELIDAKLNPDDVKFIHLSREKIIYPGKKKGI
ncbi:hypothetical protein [Chitinophaga sp. S165]|uniref:hypothetical protein n=1 Tax=Chitinophaga sp. S165 TaxID=2135462 RepID=UPI000D70BBEC|nr:hypothetical protein [Chitinophaga sp. S165]PWV55567.1 hypothetical protein C7475_10173 [Chitinophaga sp. S165]